MSDSARRSSRIAIAVLGPIRAVVDGHELELGGPRQQALLAALAQQVGRTVSVDVLIDAVWDGDPPAAASRTFRTYVARLRKSLAAVDGVEGTEVVRTDDLGYRLADDLVALDSMRFLSLVDEARDRLAVGEATTALRLLDAALDLWSGEAYAQFSDQAWARAEARRLEEQHLVARELRVQALLDSDRADEAVVEADALDLDHPFRESVARLRVVGRYRLGRHADALSVLRSFRERLAEETGLDPSAQLVELEQFVLQQDPRLDRPVAGRRLRGYLLKEVVATTTLGTVHRAEQPSIGREVAITVIDADRADDPEFVRSFEARAQQIAAVEHPHVVPLYDYWREPGGAYLVTRFHPAGSLTQRLRTDSPGDDLVRRVVQQVGGALAAAHAKGVVHGAVDLDAVLLDVRGDVFLGGFRLLEPSAGFAGDLTALADLIAQVAAGVRVGAGEPTRTSQLDHVLAAARDSGDDTISTVAGLVAHLDALVTGDRDLSPRGPRVAGPNPYRGLAAFQETDADVFFGRDELTGEVLGRLARQPFVAVSGPSGSGKSSVVRAGVLPRLRDEGAFVTAMVPGTAPLDELVVALARIASVELPADAASRAAYGDDGLTALIDDVVPTPDAEAVLVIDQYEELFTIASGAERDAFLAAIAAALDHPRRRLRVIATLRADFLGRVLEDPVAGDLVHRRTVLARPLSDDELHEAVTRPAEVAGAAVEPALATAIVADAARFPGSLPMVQFALTEVFEAADDGTMTLDAYRRIGGIEGVLGQRAEEVFQQLDEEGRHGARALYQRLVVPHDDGPPTRRRALRTEFDHVPDAVIDAFGRARLLRFDHEVESREPTVEVTHEALFRAWPRLVAWIEADEDDLRLLGHLTVSAQEWEDGGRREADLYRGHRLDAALTFARDRRNELSSNERSFLDASTARRTRDAQAGRRSVRRLRMLTSGLAVGLVLALVAGTMAVVAQRQEATTAATARARELAGLSTLSLDDDPERALLLAVEAVRVARDGGPDALPAARSALQVATARHRVTARVPAAGVRTSISPDGARIATSGSASFNLSDSPTGPDGEPTHVAIWSRDGERLTTIEIEQIVDDVAWVNDERVAVLHRGEGGGAVSVYDVSQGLVAELPRPEGGMATAVLHSAFGLVVAKHLGQPAVAWDATSGELLHTSPPGTQLTILDGERLAAWDGSSLWTIDLATGTESDRVPVAVPPASSFVVGRGDLVTFVDGDALKLLVVDVASGQVVAEAGSASLSGSVAWLDDRRVAATDNTGDLLVLDTESGAVERWRPVVADGTWDVSASADGDVLAVTSAGGAGDLAVVVPSMGAVDLGAQAGRVGMLHGLPSMDHLLANVVDGVRSVDTRTGTVDVLLDGVSIAPGEGQRTVSSADGGTVGWIDAPAEESPDKDTPLPGPGWIDRRGEVHELPPCHNPRAFTPDGRLALVDTTLPGGCEETSEDYVAHPGYVLDLETGTQTVLPTAGSEDGHQAGAVLTGEFGVPGSSAEGLVVVNRAFRYAEVVDLRTSQLLASFTPAETLLGGVVAPDGSVAAWGSYSGRVTVLDLTALQAAGALDAAAHVRYLQAGDGGVALGLEVDGDLLAAAVGADQIVVFDHTTGHRIAAFEVADNLRSGVALHRGSLYYIEGTAVRRMPLDIDEGVAIAESRLTRGWTPEECEEYGISDC